MRAWRSGCRGDRRRRGVVVAVVAQHGRQHLDNAARQGEYGLDLALAFGAFAIDAPHNLARHGGAFDATQRLRSQTRPGTFGSPIASSPADRGGCGVGRHNIVCGSCLLGKETVRDMAARGPAETDSARRAAAYPERHPSDLQHVTPSSIEHDNFAHPPLTESKGEHQ